MKLDPADNSLVNDNIRITLFQRVQVQISISENPKSGARPRLTVNLVSPVIEGLSVVSVANAWGEERGVKRKESPI